MVKLHCEVCGNNVYSRREFYICTDKNNKIPLCRKHDREMFLMGEVIMLVKYPKIRSNRSIKEEYVKEFIKRVNEIIKN